MDQRPDRHPQAQQVVKPLRLLGLQDTDQQALANGPTAWGHPVTDAIGDPCVLLLIPATCSAKLARHVVSSVALAVPIRGWL